MRFLVVSAGQSPHPAIGDQMRRGVRSATRRDVDGGRLRRRSNLAGRDGRATGAVARSTEGAIMVPRRMRGRPIQGRVSGQHLCRRRPAPGRPWRPPSLLSPADPGCARPMWDTDRASEASTRRVSVSAVCNRASGSCCPDVCWPPSPIQARGRPQGPGGSPAPPLRDSVSPEGLAIAPSGPLPGAVRCCACAHLAVGRLDAGIRPPRASRELLLL